MQSDVFPPWTAAKNFFVYILLISNTGYYRTCKNMK